MTVNFIIVDYQPDKYNEILGLFEWEVKIAFLYWKINSLFDDIINKILKELNIS